jgi:hypothetical protein
LINHSSFFFFLVIPFSFCSSGHIRGLTDLPGQPATGFITEGKRKPRVLPYRVLFQFVYFRLFFTPLLSLSSHPHTHTRITLIRLAWATASRYLLITTITAHACIGFTSLFIRFGFTRSTFSAQMLRGVPGGVLARCLNLLWAYFRGYGGVTGLFVSR